MGSGHELECGAKGWPSLKDGCGVGTRHESRRIPVAEKHDIDAEACDLQNSIASLQQVLIRPLWRSSDSRADDSTESRRQCALRLR